MKSKETNHDEETIKAQGKIKNILICFYMLSIFTNEDHTSIVKKLYFSPENIIKRGVGKTAQAVFIPERTLQTYRQKYCEIINIIISWDEESFKIDF